MVHLIFKQFIFVWNETDKTSSMAITENLQRTSITSCGSVKRIALKISSFSSYSKVGK